MKTVHVYSSMELDKGRETYYGNVTIRKTALSRKKGYGEAVIAGMRFCWHEDHRYGSSPLYVYENERKEAAFVSLSVSSFTRLKRMFGEDLAAAFEKSGAKLDKFPEAVKSSRGDVDFLLSPDNLHKFHYLSVYLYRKPSIAHLVSCTYDNGRWYEKGGGEIFRNICREVRTV